MTVSLKHAFESMVSDGEDDTLIRPSNWNAEHVITMATARVLGRTTSEAGAVEELSASDLRTFLNVEDGADATDATNVGSAGAFMKSVDDSGDISIIDVGEYYTGTTVEDALQEAGAALAAVGTPVQLKGTWDASGGSFPGSGTAQAGWSYVVSVSGTVDSVAFTANDRILAIADNASTSTYAANWHKLDYTDQVLSVDGRTGAVTLTDLYQPLDPDLTSIADLTTTSFGRGLLELADAAALVTQVGYTAGYIYGLTLSNNATDATNDIDIAAGACRSSLSSSAVGNMDLSAALTKRLDASWAVGTGNGGLDTGSIADGTYHVHLIRRSDTGVVDALFSLSATAPTMPSNYDSFRRIGSILRASGSIRAFVQTGDEFLLLQGVEDVNETGPVTTAVLRTLSVPSGINVEAFVNLIVHDATASTSTFALITSPSQTDVAASGSDRTVSVQSNGGSPSSASATIRIRTNTSAQVRSRVSNTTDITLWMYTYGWLDRRGRDG